MNCLTRTKRSKSSSGEALKVCCLGAATPAKPSIQFLVLRDFVLFHFVLWYLLSWSLSCPAYIGSGIVQVLWEEEVACTMAMKAAYMGFCVCLCLCLCLWLQLGSAQDNVGTVNGYRCLNGTSRPCQTYVHYRAQAPDMLNLYNISDLFGTSRFQIALASNLSALDSNSLSAGQELLVPISCNCMNNYSQSNMTYEIVLGNTFYLVSTGKFENLTTYQAVEVANPLAVPTNLQVGDLIIFPIRCQCPTAAQLLAGIRMIITYVIQPSDTTLAQIASKFGATEANIRAQPGNNVTSLVPFDTILIPVSRKPVLVQPAAGTGKQAPPPPPATNTANTTNTTSSAKTSYKGALIAVAAAESAVLLACLALLLWAFLALRRRNKQMQDATKSGAYAAVPSSPGHTTKTKLIAGISELIEKPFTYSFEDIKKATDDFSPEHCIQGSVYRGEINGTTYAIKQMKGESWQSQELKILQRANHANVVRLEGVCVDGPEGQAYLVYEYLQRGSLSTWLHGRQPGLRPLTWRTRVHIAVDVASGLQYMHEHTQPAVVHKDIKSSNILVDSSWRAKIANFGLAKSAVNALTRHIIGTQGYMAPEYLADGVVTPKLDVFALGVVLLELISGETAILRDQNGVPISGHNGLLSQQIARLLDSAQHDMERQDRLHAWMDPALRQLENNAEREEEEEGEEEELEEEVCMASVLVVAKVARECVEDEPHMRPSLAEIVFKLSNALDICSLSSPQDDVSISKPMQAR